jgi:hypothetical protein
VSNVTNIKDNLIPRLAFDLFLKGRVSNGISFDKDAIKMMFGPCVYIFLNQLGEAIYVGMSSNGVARCLNKTRSSIVKQAHELLIYPTLNVDIALETETILIAAFDPPLNKRLGKVKQLRENIDQFKGTFQMHARLDAATIIDPVTLKGLCEYGNNPNGVNTQ